MVDVLLDPAGTVLDDRPVRRVDPANPERLESRERIHVVEKISVAGRDDRRGSGENHVAREQRLFLDEVKAEVVGGVTGGVNGDQGGAVALDLLAVTQIMDR